MTHDSCQSLDPRQLWQRVVEEAKKAVDATKLVTMGKDASVHLQTLLQHLQSHFENQPDWQNFQMELWRSLRRPASLFPGLPKTVARW